MLTGPSILHSQMTIDPMTPDPLTPDPLTPDQENNTTAVVQRYVKRLAELPDDAAHDDVIRDLLSHAVDRLQVICSAVLHQRYPRLTQAPLSLQAEELLSAVVERLLKAMQKVKPRGVREFFSMANQHIRWELNDLARRLDNQDAAAPLLDLQPIAPESSEAELSQSAIDMLQAIDELPDAERETFELVRIQGLTQVEAAEILQVSTKTIQRRLNQSLLLLTQKLSTSKSSHLNE